MPRRRAALRRQIHSETPDPVCDGVMFTRDRLESGLAVFGSCRFQSWNPRVVGGKIGDDFCQHPSPAQVQSVEMSQLAIADVGRNNRTQPGRGIITR